MLQSLPVRPVHELQAHGDRDATQEVEPCFADKPFADDAKVAEMSEDVREIMAKAAEMIAIDDMYNVVLPDEAYARDFRDGSDQVDEIWLLVHFFSRFVFTTGDK